MKQKAVIIITITMAMGTTTITVTELVIRMHSVLAMVMDGQVDEFYFVFNFFPGQHVVEVEIRF